jgi:hypothetical protein
MKLEGIVGGIDLEWDPESRWAQGSAPDAENTGQSPEDPDVGIARERLPAPGDPPISLSGPNEVSISPSGVL